MRSNFTLLVLGVAAIVAGCHTRGAVPDPQSVNPWPAAPGAPPQTVAPTLVPTPKPTAKAKGELPPTEAARACLTTAGELEKQGFDAEAIGHYEHARRLDPKATEVSARLAVLYGRTGDDRRALAEFEKALKLRPTDPDLLSDAGYFHAAREDWPTAERQLTQAVRLKPDHARAWANLAVVYAKTGCIDDSRKAFARVVSPAEAEYNLGVLLAGQGRTDDARACLRAAANLDPQLLQVGHMLKQLDNPAATDGVVPASRK